MLAKVERELGVSKEKLNQALTILEAEGYPIGIGAVSQATNPGQQTIIRAIGTPDLAEKRRSKRDIFPSRKC